MSETPQPSQPAAQETKPTVVVEDAPLPPQPTTGSVAPGGPDFRRRGRETAVVNKVPMARALRSMGYNVPGLHHTDSRGQYDASGKKGPNDPCECPWSGEQPHKVKRHEKVAGPLIRAELEKAKAAATTKAAYAEQGVETVKAEPTVS